MGLYPSIFYFGIYLCFHDSVFADVVISPVNASVIEHSPITLICSLTGTTNTAKYYSWYIKKGLESRTADVGIIASFCYSFGMSINLSVYDYACPNNMQSTWTIKNVTRQNHGDRYQCNIETSIGNETSENTFIYVEVPVSSVTMSASSLSVVAVKEDEEAIFMCKTSGSRPEATVTWYKNAITLGDFADDEEITSHIETASLLVNGLTTVNSTLKFRPTRKDNGMNIYCKANNLLGQTPVISTRKPLLNVYYKTSVPSFFVVGHDGQSNVVVTEHDENIEIICAIESNPASTIKIMFEGQILKRERNTKNLSVVRSQVDCLHSGHYTCEGNNGYGQPSSLSLTLSVKCSPRPLHRVKNNVTSSTNVPVTLSFTALAYPYPGPKGFSWYKEGVKEWRPILGNADLHISSSSLQSNLTILNVTQADFGRYRITVINSMGSYEEDFLLSVKGTSSGCVCEVEADTSNVILGVTSTSTSTSKTLLYKWPLALGIICVVLAIYAASITILYRRKTCKEKQSRNELSRHRTYANVSFETDVTENRRQRDEQIRSNTSDQDGDDDNLDMQYTDLVRHPQQDHTTYDIIQPTE